MIVEAIEVPSLFLRQEEIQAQLILAHRRKRRGAKNLVYLVYFGNAVCLVGRHHHLVQQGVGVYTTRSLLKWNLFPSKISVVSSK